MDFAQLKWIKVVTPQGEEPWAYSRQHLHSLKQQLIDHPDVLTIFPLGFKRKGSQVLKAGELMILTQRARLTHVVEILDDDFFEQGGWFFRYVKVIWWEPEPKLEQLPHPDEVLEFPLNIQQGIPYAIETSIKAFPKNWGDRGGLTAFHKHLAETLTRPKG